MFAEIRTPDGSPYKSDPRVILSKTLERLNEHGFSHMNIGPEAEFFYFKDETGPTLLDNAGYFDINPVDVGDDVREATVFALEAMGVPVEYHHSEVGPSPARDRHPLSGGAADGRQPPDLQVRGEGSRQALRGVRHVHAQAHRHRERQRHAHTSVDLQGRVHQRVLRQERPAFT